MPQKRHATCQPKAHDITLLLSISDNVLVMALVSFGKHQRYQQLIKAFQALLANDLDPCQQQAPHSVYH